MNGFSMKITVKKKDESDVGEAVKKVFHNFINDNYLFREHTDVIIEFCLEEIPPAQEKRNIETEQAKRMKAVEFYKPKSMLEYEKMLEKQIAERRNKDIQISCSRCNARENNIKMCCEICDSEDFTIQCINCL